MADSSEPAFLFLYRKGAVAPVDYLSTFATAPFCVETVSALRDKTGNQRRKKAFVTLLRRFCRKQAEAVHRE